MEQEVLSFEAKQDNYLTDEFRTMCESFWAGDKLGGIVLKGNLEQVFYCSHGHEEMICALPVYQSGSSWILGPFVYRKMYQYLDKASSMAQSILISLQFYMDEKSIELIEISDIDDYLVRNLRALNYILLRDNQYRCFLARRRDMNKYQDQGFELINPLIRNEEYSSNH